MRDGLSAPSCRLRKGDFDAASGMLHYDVAGRIFAQNTSASEAAMNAVT